jgi:peptide/nickel transport system permease protein
VSSEILDPVAEVEEAAPSRRRLRKLGWVGWVSIGVIVFALLLAILGPILAPYDPNSADLSYSNVGPLGSHLLGFDGQGRDVLSRLMVGARTTIFGAAFVALISVTIGTGLALVTAWFGGKIDAGVSSVSTCSSPSPASCWPCSQPRCSGRRCSPRRWRCRSRTRRTSPACCAARRSRNAR